MDFAERYEQLVASYGLGEPWQRFLAGALVAEGIVLALKPSAMFDNAGNARPWSLITDADITGKDPTPVPHFFAPLAGGLLFGILL